MLSSPLILLDANKIKKRLKKSSEKITVLEKIGSTNDYLKLHADQQVCLAEMQTQGRGRFNRSWHSPFGQNIYLSMRYAFQKDLSELSGLSLITALAVCRAIESIISIRNLKIKWPNDIVIGSEKIAGILIDVSAESHGYCDAIIGVGINVNMQNAAKKEIKQLWSSLQKITGKYIDRNVLSAAIINTVSDEIARFSKLGLSDFAKEWAEKDDLFGKSVVMLLEQKKITGIGAGINAQGHLMLKMPDKTLRAFSSGDASKDRV
ncbi:MAG: biotin--[acetyl-CoA-carboxylase] ligase [Gammaproteobacteria bacterium RIFCSPHIGHO2_12_FULL_41_25]|nr:MAG: biotin--[acetyl-CoA-carboxylase] ligase [Gammaproteobacteria bacterium RIFCSPHIGHO2_02_FULL_42_43]OGT29299.1 MAG: biotin--[acetyl-CoA-carboxylase] ligase [Gammaproteobacteria bacterium RIFCSPHIGHO2_01_FULL_42_8]OGT50760.1 MAG: biotin--[acetyl-CoA-carboxylase] ligase [Gammaproteobacteria bacterium RIFCSPHIGHO2_12_FULL_41_25]OGT85489.1 MAG: biotin--[acetyl-CoA-carboxylase] ligase [Gammaproteobacteria bacterium RIFCSPLOWO2_12_FULL_42_18]